MASAVVRWLRLFGRALVRDRAFDRAGSLAYSTLIALFPLLLLIFAVVDAAGFLGENASNLENLLFGTFLGDLPLVREFLAPGLREVDFGALGLIGTAFLLYIAFQIYRTLEKAYCDLFKVPMNRSFGQRMVNFYLALTAAPVLLAALLLGTETLSARLSLPWLGTWGFALAPAVVFALAIRQLPCTKVRWGPAWIGGLTSAVLLRIGVSGFGVYLSTFAANSPVTVVYGSIGVLPMFLLWLYLAWVFVLIGVELAHFVQEYSSLVKAEGEEALRAEPADRVPGPETALRLLFAIHRAFRSGEAPVPVEDLTRATHLTESQAAPLLALLATHRLAVATADGWTMARPAEAISIREVLRAWQTEMALDPSDPGLEALLPEPGTLNLSVEAVGARLFH